MMQIIVFSLIPLFVSSLKPYSPAKKSWSETRLQSNKISADDVILSLGLDFGTSGVRSCLVACVKERGIAIDMNDRSNFVIKHESQLLWRNAGLKADSPSSWLDALLKLLSAIPPDYRSNINRICISGTSSSAVIYDCQTVEVSAERGTRMYNFNIQDNDSVLATEVMRRIKKRCPPDSTTAASTSTLAKLLLWQLQKPLKSQEVLIHQADYLTNALLVPGFIRLNRTASSQSPINPNQLISDWHNALKLGFDVQELRYPQWLLSLLSEDMQMSTSVLPAKVLQPGQSAGLIDSLIASELGLNPSCAIVAGTTDSIAAFLAAGASELGQAVTSLGSTLAIKALSDRPVQDSSRGIYSHRLAKGNLWLVGGASNVGCAILPREGFSDEELVSCSARIDPQRDCEQGLGRIYYPLLAPGERFPENDPHKQPVLTPRPADRALYLQGILEAIARVEKKGFDALEELGATPVTQVFTAGGGSKNDMWTQMRARILGKRTARAANVDAAFGCARLGVWHLDRDI